MKKLTLKACGLLQYMSTLEKEFTVEEASQNFADGKTAIRTALDELRHAGLITRVQIRNKNGTLGGTEYKIKGDLLS